MAIYDPVIKMHIEKVSKKSEEMRKKRLTVKKDAVSSGRGSMVTFLSKNFVRKVIITIGEMISKTIAKEVNLAKIFSLEVDSTQDVSVKDQLCICVRYVNCNSEEDKDPVKERFLRMVDVRSGTGKNLYETIKKELADLNIDLRNVVSKSFDGAANMSGKYNGVQKHILDDSPNSLFTHCHAHVLNLIIQDLVQCCINAQNLFGLIQTTSVFLTESYKRKNIWADIVTKNETGAKKNMNLKKIFEVRWNTADAGLRAIFNSWQDIDESQVAPTRTPYLNLLKALQIIGYSEEVDPKTATDARNLLQKWTSYEVILTAFLFLQLFNETTPTSKYLQTKGLDYITAWNHINHLIKRVKLLSDESNYNLLKGRVATFINVMSQELEEEEEIEFENDFPSRRIKRLKKRAGEETSDEKSQWSPDQRYRVDVFRRVYDVVSTSLDTRFKENASLLNGLACLDPKRFEDLNEGKLNDIRDSLRFLTMKAGVDFETLIAELTHFARCYKNGDLAIGVAEETDEDEHVQDQDAEESENSEDDIGIMDEVDEDGVIGTGKEKECGKCARCVFNFLKTYNLHSAAYTNLYILYKYILTLSCTQVNCERTFSILKIIKNRLRSLMGQDLLQSLLLISIEGGTSLSEIKIDDIIDEIARSTKLLTRLLIF